jgi:hypothetical protein
MKLEVLEAFSAHLAKEAAEPLSLARGVGRFLSRNPAATAALGSLGGAAMGAYESDGENVVGGALGGAVRGAVAGGMTGYLGRVYRDARLLNPGMGGGEAFARRLGGSVKNFGKRTVHGLTGMLNPAEAGMQSTLHAKDQARLVSKRLIDEMKYTSDPAARRKLMDDAREEIAGLYRAGKEGDQAIAMGVTHLPGTIKGLASKETRGETAKYLGKQMIGGGGALGTVMGVGIPLGFGAYDVMQGDESATGGRTVPQKFVNLGVTTATGGMMGGMPVGAQLVAQTGIDKLVMPKVMETTNRLVHPRTAVSGEAPVSGESPGRLPVT